MPVRTIPSTGEELPVIGLGSWIQFDVDPAGPERESLSCVLKQMAGDGGGLIDSSPMYGNAERVIGELTQLAGIDSGFFYATKIWTSGETAGIKQLESSMRKMRRSVMDLVQVHNLLDWQLHLKTLRKAKEEGKIRYTGITHYVSAAHAKLEQIIRSNPVDFVQFNYSINDRHAENSLFDAAREKAVAVIINEPFESGSLLRSVEGKQLPGWAADLSISTWAQFLLKFIISHPAVTCVIPGTSDPVHLADNMQAAQGEMPDEKTRLKMAAWFKKI